MFAFFRLCERACYDIFLGEFLTEGSAIPGEGILYCTLMGNERADARSNINIILSPPRSLFFVRANKLHREKNSEQR